MEDEVFIPLMVPVPDLSYPPPSWVLHHHQQARGKGAGGGHHPTRVIRRTDLRGGRGGQRQPQQQRPPRFNNFQSFDEKRKSWGEEWKPKEEKTQKEDPVSRVEVKDEYSGDGEGEWKEVKGRRWGKTEEIKKVSSNNPDLCPPRRKTPEPVVSNRKSPESKQAQRKSPNIHGQTSPADFPPPVVRYHNPHHRKSPEQVSERKSSGSNYQRKSPHLRKSPPLSSEAPIQKTNPESKRRGSNSSNEGDSLVFRNKKKSPSPESRKVTLPPRFQDKKPEYRISEKYPTQKIAGGAGDSDFLQNSILLSELPDERMVQSTPVVKKQLSADLEMMREEESRIKVQKEILAFLRKNWQEVSDELNESKHEWPSKVTYYSNHILV